MKKKCYQDLKVLLCALSTSVLFTGCTSETSEYLESKSFEHTEAPTQKIETLESTELESKTFSEVPTKVIEDTTISQSTKDEQVLAYITNLSDSIDNGVEVITDKAKDGFITVIDFLFYDGTIADTTFAELSNKAKEKVIIFTSNLIEKVDVKYPDFRMTLSEKYQDASTFVVEKKKILVNKVKESLGDEKVNQISEYYQDVKGGLSNAYEKGKGKVKNWYDNFKNKNREESTE